MNQPRSLPAIFSLLGALTAALAVPASSALAEPAAAPNPPMLLPLDEPIRYQAEPLGLLPLAAPSVEWTLHKSGDGADPSPAEQKLLWLMNRARTDPAAEGIWLATDSRSDIKSGRDFFNVNLNVLKSEFGAYPAKAPAAFDIRLHDASVLHSEDLIVRDAQDHDGQFARVNASGFSCNGGRVSVFAYSSGALNTHAALNIDWGSGSDGTQDPPGHRYAIMGFLPDPPGSISLSNVGLALVSDTNPATEVGPQVFSGAYCHAGGSDHNRFIVGTVWEDADADGEYDAGEGLGGVTVMPNAGTYYAVTGNAGGYAIPVGASGTYQVSFSGGDLAPAVITQSVAVGAESALLDLEAGNIQATPLASFHLPHFGGGADAEAVLMLDRGGAGEAAVVDLGTGTPVSTVGFTPGLLPITAARIADGNGNGADDIAGLMLDPVKTLPKVEIRDGRTGAKIRNVNFSQNHDPVALAVIASQDGNPSPEGVVLARQTTRDDRGRLLIRDLVTRDTLINISLPRIYAVLGLAMAPDITGNGAAEALVLATRRRDGRGSVLVWDTGGAGRVALFRIQANHQPIALTHLVGPGGADAVAVAALRLSDLRGRLFVHDALTGGELWAVTVRSGREPVAVEAFQAANGAWRLALLMRETSDGRPLVTVYDAATGDVRTNVLYDAGLNGVALAVMPDSSLDAGSQPELGVVMENGSVQMRLRDSVTGALVQTITP